jgi:hypothetical protein
MRGGHEGAGMIRLAYVSTVPAGKLRLTHSITNRKKVLCPTDYNPGRQGDLRFVLGANPDLSYRLGVITYQ